MPPRQKLLLLGLIAAVLMWQGGIWGNRLLLEPLRVLRADVARRQEKVNGLKDQALAIELAQAKLNAYRSRSLPLDLGKKGGPNVRPDAVDAQRQYTAWLTELVHTIGFDDIAVAPQRRSVSRNNVYVEVAVQINGEGRFSQLAELLDRFYRTDLLQRIGRLQIVSQDVIGDPPVKFTLEADVLALSDAPVRRTIFPRTTLVDELPADASRLSVASAAEFLPKKTPFEVRVERELLTVTTREGETWTVSRGVERTERADHAAKLPLTLVPINRQSPEMTTEEFRNFVRTNVFVKPTPPTEYDLKFGPFASVVVTRGKTWEYSLAAKDYDPARGEPKYRIEGKSPAGLSLNESTGRLVWKPDTKLSAGDYPLKVSVVHPSAPNGRFVAELPLVLADPNSPPKLPAVGPQTVYRGQPWKITVTANDADRPAQQLTFKLGTGAPAGSQIDAASGELTWTPDENQPLGPASLLVSVTDSGTPSKTSNITILVSVMEDAAKQTMLIGIVTVDGEREAMFLDKSQNRKRNLHVGDEIRAADISAEIIDIAATYVTVRRGEAEQRLKLGETVRSLSSVVPVIPSDSAETPN